MDSKSATIQVKAAHYFLKYCNVAFGNILTIREGVHSTSYEMQNMGPLEDQGNNPPIFFYKLSRQNVLAI